MKTINEMSEKEILSLTGEQLETLVKIRMAQEGIKILSEPVKPEYLPIAEPDVLAYDVEGYNLIFTDIETAQKASQFILELKDKLKKEVYGRHYQLKTLTSGDDRSYHLRDVGKIQPKKFYSKKLLAEMEDSFSANERTKKQYDTLLAEYTDNYNSAASIREEIYDRYNEVVDKYSNMERMKSKYSEYLTLAENDSTIAMNFLKKAYTIDAETEQFVTA